MSWLKAELRYPAYKTYDGTGDVRIYRGTYQRMCQEIDDLTVENQRLRDELVRIRDDEWFQFWDDRRWT